MNHNRIHSAFLEGDLRAIRSELGDPVDFPNSPWGECGDYCLDYALYHSPISLVRELLQLGADPNYPDSGFPSLFAALTSNHQDRCDRIHLLLDFGADIQQRGVNDYTPLHFAVSNDNGDAVTLLLSRGADASARTRIDHYATPLEEGLRFGHSMGVDALRRHGVHA